MDFKQLIDKMIDNKINASMPANVFYAKLTKLNPLTFQPEDSKIEYSEQFLVVPKYQVFTSSDIGKNFVFISNNGGQTAFFLYEPSNPQGSNGVPYKFKGEFKGILNGEPHNGTIEEITHKEGI